MVEGLWFLSSGLMVYGPGFKVLRFEFRVQGLGCWAESLGFGFRVSGLKFIV